MDEAIQKLILKVDEVDRVTIIQFLRYTNPREVPFKKFQGGQTLLHFAAGYGRVKLVQYLLRDGAQVDEQDNDGLTPLHNASNHGHYNTSNILIKAGANVNKTDNRGWTALHFVLARKDNSGALSALTREVVKLLIESGANPYLKTFNRNKRSLDLINDREDKVKIITDHLSVQYDSPDNDFLPRDEIINKCIEVKDFFEILLIGDDQLDILRAITTRELLDSRLEACGDITPLHRAAGFNRLETAKFFLSRGASLDATDRFGRIPLHNAAQYGHVTMIKLLVNKGSDINKQDIEGYSPIHVAALSKTHAACETLKGLDANIYLKCKKGKLPYDLAHSDEIRAVLKPNTFKTVQTSNESIYLYDHQFRPNPIESTNNQDELLLDSRHHEFTFSSDRYKIKLVPIPSSDWRFKEIVCRMKSTIVEHKDDLLCGKFVDYDILRIDRLEHKPAWESYKLRCKMLENKGTVRNEKMLFHGSRFIDDIQRKGFEEGYARRDSMFGAGIYFAEHSSKSNQYTFGWGQGCDKHRDKTCFQCERKMIYSQVALGKSLISKEALPECSHAPPGYFSVTATPEATDGLLYPEYVVYSGDQAYPLYIITYRITK